MRGEGVLCVFILSFIRDWRCINSRSFFMCDDIKFKLYDVKVGSIVFI